MINPNSPIIISSDDDDNELNDNDIKQNDDVHDHENTNKQKSPCSMYNVNLDDLAENFDLETGEVVTVNLCLDEKEKLLIDREVVDQGQIQEANVNHKNFAAKNRKRNYAEIGLSYDDDEDDNEQGQDKHNTKRCAQRGPHDSKNEQPFNFTKTFPNPVLQNLLKTSLNLPKTQKSYLIISETAKFINSLSNEEEINQAEILLKVCNYKDRSLGGMKIRKFIFLEEDDRLYDFYRFCRVYFEEQRGDSSKKDQWKDRDDKANGDEMCSSSHDDEIPIELKPEIPVPDMSVLDNSTPLGRLVLKKRLEMQQKGQ